MALMIFSRYTLTRIADHNHLWYSPIDHQNGCPTSPPCIPALKDFEGLQPGCSNDFARGPN